MLLGIGGVEEALVRGRILANAVGANDVDDAVLRTLKAEATPSSQAGWVGNGCVSSAGPSVVSKEECASWLVDVVVAAIRARRVGNFGIEEMFPGLAEECGGDLGIPANIGFGCPEDGSVKCGGVVANGMPGVGV